MILRTSLTLVDVERCGNRNGLRHRRGGGVVGVTRLIGGDGARAKPIHRNGRAGDAAYTRRRGCVGQRASRRTRDRQGIDREGAANVSVQPRHLCKGI